MTDQASGSNASGYRVLARKYRPKTFADLIGQEALVRTLTNAFSTGRVAQAYILTGVRGVGKTTTARLIARALNYPAGPTVDMPEITPTCEAILESRHMDVIEMDAASNTGVDNMREIIDSVRYAPVQARTKVYIIDEVHMLSKSAFNALLKTLEEPPPHVKFVFATTEIRKVPVTILSRCQRFDLRRLDAGLLTQHYARIADLEGAEAEEEALRLIARASEGSVRDGLSLLDQAIAFGDGKVKAADVAAMLGVIDRTRVIELFDAVMAGEPGRAIEELAAQYQAGADPQTVLTELAEFVHWVTRLKIVPKPAHDDTSKTAIEKSRGLEFAAKLSIPRLGRAWQMLLKGIAETAAAANPEQAAEMVLIRLAHAADLPSGDQLARMVKEAGTGSPISPMRRDAVQPQPSSQPPAAGPQASTTASPALALRPGHDAAPTVQATPIARLEDIAELAGQRRDLRFKSDIERFIRPIAVGEGKIEIALEQGAPQGLANEMARKLESWTGRRWMVMVAREGGGATLAKRKGDARSAAEREAMELPAVKAALKLFPSARLVKVRGYDDLPTPDTPQEETDEESR